MVVESQDQPLDQIQEETAEDEGDSDPNPEDDDQVEKDDVDAEDDEDDANLDLEGLSQVLTVLAKKLAGLTLGRKFSTQKPGKPSKDESAIAKKKQNSHCMACGLRGHWKGDPACALTPAKSSSYVADSKGGAQKGRPNFQKQRSSPQQKSQAFTVVHHEHGSLEVSDDRQNGNVFHCNIWFMFPRSFKFMRCRPFQRNSLLGS